MNQLQKNISFTGFHQLYVAFLAFLLVPIATRFLGVEDFGRFTLATTIGFIVNLAADMGLSTITTREISKYPRIKSRLFAVVLGTKFILAGIALLLLLLLLKIVDYPQETRQIILIFSCSSIISSFSIAAFSVFRGVEQMQYEAVGTFIEKSISFTLGVLVLFLGFGLDVFIWSFIVSGLFLVYYSFSVLFKRYVRFKITMSTSRAIVLLKISCLLGASSFLSMAYNYLDILMLSKMGSMADIGNYSAAYRILAISRIVPTILATAFLPRFSANHQNTQELKILFSKGLHYLFIFIFPLVLVTFLLAKEIILFIAGADFVEGAVALKILAFAVSAQMLNIFYVPLYVSTNNQKKIVHIQVFGLIVNILLNLILIPKISFVGAAIATVATELSILIILSIWIKARLKIYPSINAKFIIKLFISTIIMLGLLLFLNFVNLHLVVILMISIGGYFIALELSGLVTVRQFILDVLPGSK